MERLKELREQKGLSRETLAASAAIGANSLWRYETGRRSPTAETLEKLALVLDVEVADFFPIAQAPLPLNFGVDAERSMEVVSSMEIVSRVRAELLEKLADLWSLQLDRCQYDTDTLMAMDWCGVVLGLNHAKDEGVIKQFLEPEAGARLARAEGRLSEHASKLKGVLEHSFGQGQVVEMQQYLAQRGAQLEEARREISSSA